MDENTLSNKSVMCVEKDGGWRRGRSLKEQAGRKKWDDVSGLQVDSWSLARADALSAGCGEIAGGDKWQWEKPAKVRGRAGRDGWISQGAKGKVCGKRPNVTAELRDFCTSQGQHGLGIHLSNALQGWRYLSNGITNSKIEVACRKTGSDEEKAIRGRLFI